MPNTGIVYINFILTQLHFPGYKLSLVSTSLGSKLQVLLNRMKHFIALFVPFSPSTFGFDLNRLCSYSGHLPLRLYLSQPSRTSLFARAHFLRFIMRFQFSCFLQSCRVLDLPSYILSRLQSL